MRKWEATQEGIQCGTAEGLLEAGVRTGVQPHGNSEHRRLIVGVTQISKCRRPGYWSPWPSVLRPGLRTTCWLLQDFKSTMASTFPGATKVTRIPLSPLHPGDLHTYAARNNSHPEPWRKGNLWNGISIVLVPVIQRLAHKDVGMKAGCKKLHSSTLLIASCHQRKGQQMSNACLFCESKLGD